MVSSDDVVGSLNGIVTVHRRISESWTNPSNNTSGPQVDRILLKSFKLFPTLTSLATEDVVGFAVVSGLGEAGHSECCYSLFHLLLKVCIASLYQFWLDYSFLVVGVPGVCYRF